MTIENLPAFFDMIFVKEDRKLSTDGYLYNDQTFQTLNYVVQVVNGTVITLIDNTTGTLTINGLLATPKTSAEITTLVSSTDVAVGALWYDSTIKKLRFKSDIGTVETITSV